MYKTLINIDANKCLLKNYIINKYNNYEITYLCFDNDKAGNNFANKIKNGINKSFIRILPNSKDFNEDLMKL